MHSITKHNQSEGISSVVVLARFSIPGLISTFCFSIMHLIFPQIKMYLTHIFSRGRVKVWVGVKIDLRVYGLNAAAFNSQRESYCFKPIKFLD